MNDTGITEGLETPDAHRRAMQALFAHGLAFETVHEGVDDACVACPSSRFLAA